MRLATALSGVGHCDMDFTGDTEDDKKQSRESLGRWMSGVVTMDGNGWLTSLNSEADRNFLTKLSNITWPGRNTGRVQHKLEILIQQKLISGLTFVIFPGTFCCNYIT